MATTPVKGVIRQVKPLLSLDKVESRRRVIALYKAWYRQIPDTVVKYALPITISEARAKLKSEFIKHKDVRDIRVIDMLVIKGQMNLKEMVKGWKQQCHIMYMTKDSYLPKPTTFLSKFIAGSE